MTLLWFRSLAYGFTGPTVVLWWVQFPDGSFHIKSEYAQPGQTIAELARAMHARTSRLQIARVQYTVTDPIQMAGRVKESDGPTRGQTFRACGISTRGNSHDPIQGWTRVRDLLDTPPTRIRPWLTIDPSCVSVIRALTNALSKTTDPEDVETDDPTLLALRLGAMSRPATPTFARPPLPPNAAGHLLTECLRGGTSRGTLAWRSRS